MKKFLTALLIAALCCPAAMAGVHIDSVKGEYWPALVPSDGQYTLYLSIENTYPHDIWNLYNGFRVYSETGCEWATLRGWWNPEMNWSSYFNYGTSIEYSNFQGSDADSVCFIGFGENTGGIYPGFFETSFIIQVDLARVSELQTFCVDSVSFLPDKPWLWSLSDWSEVEPSWPGPICPMVAPAASVSPDPAACAYGVSDSPVIKATFDKEADQYSIDFNTFRVYGSQHGYIWGYIDYGVDPQTAQYVPSASFNPGEEVTVVLTSHVDVEWPLFGGYTWFFTVGSTPGPNEFPVDEVYMHEGLARQLFAADVDDDGDVDLVAPLRGDPIFSDHDLVVLKNLGDGSFDTPEYFDFVSDNTGRTMDMADIDNDGDLDAILLFGGRVITVLNDGSGGFSPVAEYPSPEFTSWGSICIADINNDGYSDLIVGQDYYQDGILVMLNDQSGGFEFTDEIAVAVERDLRCIGAGDFDFDGDLDLAVGHPDAVSVAMGNGDGTLEPASLETFSSSGFAPVNAQICDISGDGLPDILLGDDYAWSLLVYGNGDGTFTDPTLVQGEYGAGYGQVVLDITGDGIVDRASIEQHNDRIVVTPGFGDGTFDDDIYYPPGVEHPNGIVAADFDGDGDMDFAVPSDWDGIAVLLDEDVTTCCVIRGDMNRSGTLDISDLTYLVSYMFQGGPPPPCDIEGDVDLNGKTDISDLTYLVAYLFQGGPPPPPCP